MIENSISGDVAFICDTPLQILNSINLIQNDIIGSRGSSDIFIYHQFSKSEMISKNLNNLNLFNNVYNVEKYKTYTGFKSKLITLYRILFPHKTIKRYLKEELKLKKKNYKYLVISCQTTFITNMHMLFDQAEIVLMEDGVGTYFGDILHDYSSKLFCKFDRIFANSKMGLYPKRLFVRNTQICELDYNITVGEVPYFRQVQHIEQIKKIFSYKTNDLYKNKKIIFLTQPLDEQEGFSQNNYNKIWDMMLGVIKDNLIIRIHPRQLDFKGEGIERDQLDNLWELECLEQITDEHILISAFSTAQFMPKLLTNCEPIIIFIYKLFFDNFETGVWLKTKEFVNKFKESYRNSDKIFEPQTVEELVEILNNI